MANNFNFNDVLKNFNFNVLNESDDDSSFIIILFVLGLIFVAVISVMGIFFINKRRQSEDESAGLAGDGSQAHGARDPAVQQIIAQVPPDPPSGFSMSDFIGMLGPLLLGIGIGVAMDSVFWALKRLGTGSRNLIKSTIRASAAFKSALRPKFNVRAAMKSGRKFLAKNLMKLSMSSRVLFGMLWSKALRAAGVSAARIEALLAAKIGPQAASLVAARAASQVATKTAGMGPFAAVELVVGVTGMALDITNTGGYMTIDGRKTSDLLVERERQSAVLKNSFIQGPTKDDGTIDTSSAAGFYPLYWGPLDEMNDVPGVDGLDAFDILVEERMFSLLFADDPDPFITKLFVHMAQRYGTSTTDIEQLISACMLTDMSQEDYWGLYDRAFNSLCTENGGVLVDPGVTGVPLQCSHASETACHAKSPYTLATGPITSDDTNYTYTEWRDREFFNKNYGPAQVPSTATGACIIQSPAIPEACAESVCTKRGSGQQCGNNEYIRNRGICQNTQQLCQFAAGVSFCERMPKPGEAGQECKTGLDGKRADLGPASNILLPNETLKSCYVDSGQAWGEFFTSGTIYRYFASGGFASDIANLGTQQIGTSGVTVSGALTGGTGTALDVAQNLQQQGQQAADAAQQQNCTLNGGQYTGGQCYTCPAGQTLSPIEVDNGQGNFTITGYNCVAAPPPPPPVVQPWQHASTPTPPGVQIASLPVQTSTVSGSQSCPSGSVNSGLGCLNGYCGANTPCLTCPSGQTLSGDNAWCYECPPGTSWVNSASGCVSSLVPMIITNGSRVSKYDLPGYTCPTGSTTEDAYCVTCPSGGFYDTNAFQCKSCPAGSSMVRQPPVDWMSPDTSYCARN